MSPVSFMVVGDTGKGLCLTKYKTTFQEALFSGAIGKVYREKN